MYHVGLDYGLSELNYLHGGSVMARYAAIGHLSDLAVPIDLQQQGLCFRKCMLQIAKL